MPTGVEAKEVKSEQPKMEDENKNVVAKEMAPADVENIKKDDAERLNVAKQELEGFRKEQGGEGSAEDLKARVEQKLDEMQEKINEKKNPKGLLGKFAKMAYSDQDFINAENAIKGARILLAKAGPDSVRMKSIQEATKKFTMGVDISGFSTGDKRRVSGPNQSQY